MAARLRSLAAMWAASLQAGIGEQGDGGRGRKNLGGQLQRDGEADMVPGVQRQGTHRHGGGGVFDQGVHGVAPGA
jgi:hypothetical protein